MPAQPEDRAPAKAGERPLGELEDATPVVLRVIKIETPEASASGVFNLRQENSPLPSLVFSRSPSRVIRSAAFIGHN